MIRIVLTLCCFVGIQSLAFTQIFDPFDDGDLTSSPPWSGDLTNFFVEAGQLRSLPGSTGSYQLHTPNTVWLDQEYQIDLDVNLQLSQTNQFVFYLGIEQPNLTGISPGLYLFFGQNPLNPNLHIGVYYQKLGYTDYNFTDPLITYNFPLLSSLPKDLKVRVRIGADTLIALAVDDGLGFQEVGQIKPTLISLFPAYTGFLFRFTTSNANKLAVNSIYAGAKRPDPSPPPMRVIDLKSVSLDSFFFTFSLPLANPILEDSGSIKFNGINAISDISTSQDQRSFSVALNQKFETDSVNISIDGLKAINNQVLNNFDTTLLIRKLPQKGDIIITEFLPDPIPTRGLPAFEFVELYNTTNYYLNLDSCRIADMVGVSAHLNSTIAPKEYLVVAPLNAEKTFPETTIYIDDWPTLNNSEEKISIINKVGSELDVVSYEDDWHTNADGLEGGISLERIDLENSCNGALNFTSSENKNGGTPGSQNSVFSSLEDNLAPELLQASLLGDRLFLMFNEPIDTIGNSIQLFQGSQPIPSLPQFNPGLTQASFFGIDLSSGQKEFKIVNIKDCKGNVNEISFEAIAIKESLQHGDLIINEIMADPKIGEPEWIELYVRSKQPILVGGLSLGKFRDTGYREFPFGFSELQVLEPEGYYVVANSKQGMLNTYSNLPEELVFESTFGLLNNEGSGLSLVSDTTIIDSLFYTIEDHSPFLSSTKGVSLERTNTLEDNFWPATFFSASENSGFSTPGLPNSQTAANNNSSPTDVGFFLSQDYLIPGDPSEQGQVAIQYKLEKIGYTLTIEVYSSSGQRVATLANNLVAGLEGTILWDGITNQGSYASLGNYIILFTAVHTNGDQKNERKIFAVYPYRR